MKVHAAIQAILIEIIKINPLSNRSNIKLDFLHLHYSMD